MRITELVQVGVVIDIREDLYLVYSVSHVQVTIRVGRTIVKNEIWAPCSILLLAVDFAKDILGRDAPGVS